MMKERTRSKKRTAPSRHRARDRGPKNPPKGCALGRYSVVIFWSDEDRCFIANLPDFKTCSAHGDTPEEALREIQVAMTLWLEVARECDKWIPPVRFGPDFWEALPWG
jgi:predicted RNase H-like HicB family nuclease